MQKISYILIAFSLLAASTLAVRAQELVMTVPMDAVQSCFEKGERLSRLECYDTVLGRPEITDVSNDVPEEIPVATLPAAVKFVHGLLESKDVIEGKIHLTLRDRETQSPTLSEDGSALSLLQPSIPDEELGKRRLVTDLFLALSSEPNIGETATLVVSCENNITRLKVYFNEPFQSRFQDARFYGRENLSQEDGERRKLWVRGGGWVLENARGLDSIRLIRRLTSGSLGQISIGQGLDIRSAFFDTEALKGALPYMIRHCSWSTA